MSIGQIFNLSEETIPQIAKVTGWSPNKLEEELRYLEAKGWGRLYLIWSDRDAYKQFSYEIGGDVDRFSDPNYWGELLHLAINPGDIVPNAEDSVLCDDLKPGVLHVTQIPSDVTCPTCRERWKL